MVDSLLDLTIAFLKGKIKDSSASESSQELNGNSIQVCWFNIEISECESSRGGLVIEGHLLQNGMRALFMEGKIHHHLDDLHSQQDQGRSFGCKGTCPKP
jgi:hypothetical protein